MIIGIDATNLGSGGAIRHISNILLESSPGKHQFQCLVIWSSSSVAKAIPDLPWISKQTHPWLDRNIAWRLLWRFLQFNKEVKKFKCGVLFLPGGLFVINSKIPMVTMLQNLLPFDSHEILKFRFRGLRYFILRVTQTISLRQSQGIIFLSDYSSKFVQNYFDQKKSDYVVIPHGVESVFFMPPRVQRDVIEYSAALPLKILYVSPIWPYKNHMNLLLAAISLLKDGYPLHFEFVGGNSHPDSFNRLLRTLAKSKIKDQSIRIYDHCDFKEVVNFYHRADIFIFPSSCETFGQVVTEAMASGLPIATSRNSAMQEVLGDGAIYFDPIDPHDIYQSLKKLIESPQLRATLADRAYSRVNEYTWENCADRTFQFINKVSKSALRE